MSIGYKKIADLIEQEANKLPSLNSNQKERLANLSQRIYTLEASVDNLGTNRIVEDIMTNIRNASDDFSGVKI